MTDRIGLQLGNYRLLRFLGKGGFAEVYLGEHVYLKTPAAIKLLQMKAINQEDLEGFLKEAQIIARLVHPNIVRVLEFGLDGETPFLVMDYAPNGTLRQRHPRGTQLPLTAIVAYVKQIANALQYAHDEKLIHRDVKPENMLVGRHNAVLLSDFGIAMIAQSSRYQSTQDVIGTVAYMAPEQIQGKPRPASDQYSLGIVVYEWLCGTRPFNGSFTELCAQHMFAPVPSLHEKLPFLSPAIEQVVAVALAKDPKQRFENVEAFAQALEQACQLTDISPSIPPNRIAPTIIAPTMPVLPDEGKRSPMPVQPSEMAIPPNRTYRPQEGIFPFIERREIPAANTPLQPPYQASNAVEQPSIEPAKRGLSRRTVIVSLATVAATAAAAGGVLWLAQSHGTNSPTQGSGTNQPSSQSTSQSTGSLKFGPGVDPTNKIITLGILSAYSGPVASPIGIPVAQGIKVFFDSVSDNGGINGFKVKFLEEDTKYDLQTEVNLYNQIRSHVLMIAGSLGTPTTFAIKDLATADHMLVSVASLSSSIAREKYLFLVGTPYRLQVENAFDYVVNNLNIKSPDTGIIYQNDDYGQDGLQGYKEAVSAYSLHDVGQASYDPAATDFTTQVSQMQAAGAKYVFLSALPSVTASIVGTAARLGYSPQFILQSPAWSNLLLGVTTLKPLFTKLWVVGQGATWGDTSKPGMQQMLQDIAKYAPNQQPDGYFQSGYTQSKITYAILKKALENNDITRDGLFNAFESLKSVDLGGLLPPVSYGSTPNQRIPTRDSVVYQIDSTQPNDVKALTSDFTGTAATQSQF